MTDPGGHYLVTGASSGIGAALVELLLASGDDVLAVARRGTALQHDKLQWRNCDLADPGALSAFCKHLSRSGDPLDGAILCHGYGDFGALEQFSERRIRQLVDTNLVSTILLARAVLPVMKRAGRGRLVLLGSESALRGGRKGAVYCATKFALRGLAQSLRQECSGSGVAVTLVNPGMVNTPFFDELDFAPGESPDNALEAGEVALAIGSVLQMRAGAVIDELNISPLKNVIRQR